jgi:hypothetical protein
MVPAVHCLRSSPGGRSRSVVTTPTRIVLGEMPRLVRDLIEHAIADAPDLDVVAHDAGAGLLTTVEQTHAQLVIVAMAGEQLPQPVEDYLRHEARLAAVGVEITDGTATLYRLLPQRQPIGPVSPGELVAAIRAAAADAD